MSVRRSRGPRARAGAVVLAVALGASACASDGPDTVSVAAVSAAVCVRAGDGFVAGRTAVGSLSGDTLTAQAVPGSRPGPCRTWRLGSGGGWQVALAAPTDDSALALTLDVVTPPGASPQVRLRSYDLATGAARRGVLLPRLGQSAEFVPGSVGRYAAVTGSAGVTEVVDLLAGEVAREVPGRAQALSPAALVTAGATGWSATALADGSDAWTAPRTEGDRLRATANPEHVLVTSAAGEARAVLDLRSGTVVPAAAPGVAVDPLSSLALLTLGDPAQKGRGMTVVDLDTGHPLTDVAPDKGERQALQPQALYDGKVWLSSARGGGVIDARTGRTLTRAARRPVAGSRTWVAMSDGAVVPHDPGQFDVAWTA